MHERVAPTLLERVAFNWSEVLDPFYFSGVLLHETFPHSSSCAHVGGAFAFTLGTTSVAVVGAGIGALIGSGIGAGGIGSGAGIGSGTADAEVAADVEVEVAAGSTLMRRSIDTA